MHRQIRFKTVGIYSVVLLLVTFLLAPVLLASTSTPVSAATDSYKWEYAPNPCTSNTTQISQAQLVHIFPGGKEVFKCAGIGGNTAQRMTLNGPASTPAQCARTPKRITVGNPDPNNPSDFSKTKSGLFFDQAYLPTSGCNDNPTGGQPITIDNTYDEATTPPVTVVGTAYWTKVDPANPQGQLTATFTLGSFSNQKEVFTQSAITGNVMTLTGTKIAPNCGAGNTDTIDVGGVGAKKTYWEDTEALLTTYVYTHDESGFSCFPVSGHITLVNQTTGKPASFVDAGGTPPVNSSTPPNDCPFDPNGLNWALCDMFKLAHGAVTQLNLALKDALYVDTSKIFGKSFQDAYNAFRNIALTLVVLAGLVMVASQAAGLEIFSAYTIRKALPKLVLVTIGMALAWPILQFAVTFFNDLGTWTSDLILTAVSPVHNSGGPGFGETAIVLLFGAGAVTSAIIGLGALGILSLGATVVVGLFIAFVTLVIRQILIVMCIMLAPLAIAMAVLPGTEGLWKFWRSTLTGALVMFPIVMGFLASGEAVARIAGAQGTQNGNGNGWIFNLIAIIATFVPYFMIPVAFRLANGVMGNISGLVSERGKGVFDRLSKFREGQRTENWQKMWAGQRFKGTTPIVGRLGGGLNQLGSKAGAFRTSEDKLGFLRKRGREAAYTRHQDMVNAEYAKRPGTQATQFNDDMLWAQTYENAAVAKRELMKKWADDPDQVNKVNSAIAAASAQGGFGRAQQTYATAQLAATGTGYKNMGDMLSTIARVSNGNEGTINSMVGNMRPLVERSGRNDLKASYGTMTKIASDIHNNDNQITRRDSEGNIVRDLSTNVEDSIVEAGMGTDNASLLRNKTGSVENISKALVSAMDRHTLNSMAEEERSRDTSRTADERAAAALAQKQAERAAGAIRAKIENMKTSSQLGYGPEANAEAYTNVVFGTPAKPGDTPVPGSNTAPGPLSNRTYTENIQVINNVVGTKEPQPTVPGGLADYPNLTAQEYYTLRQRQYGAGDAGDIRDPRNMPPAPPTE